MRRLLVCTLLAVFAATGCDDGDDSADAETAEADDPANDCVRRELRKKRSVLAERAGDCAGNDIRTVVLRGGANLTLEVEFAGVEEQRPDVVRGDFDVRGRERRKADNEEKARRRAWRLTFRCDERERPRFNVLFGHGPVQRLRVRTGSCTWDEGRLLVSLDRELFELKGTTGARPTAVDVVAWSRLDDGPYTRSLDRLDAPLEIPEELRVAPVEPTSTTTSTTSAG